MHSQKIALVVSTISKPYSQQKFKNKFVSPSCINLKPNVKIIANKLIETYAVINSQKPFLAAVFMQASSIFKPNY
jgi:hypothetical protein